MSLDSQQDYQLIEAKQTPEGFYLLFKRPFSTCDPRDYIIEVWKDFNYRLPFFLFCVCICACKKEKGVL